MTILRHRLFNITQTTNEPMLVEWYGRSTYNNIFPIFMKQLSYMIVADCIASVFACRHCKYEDSIRIIEEIRHKFQTIYYVFHVASQAYFSFD